jgi:DNA-binding CsgD family transcriptional regulator
MGHVAIRYAEKHPETVRALVLWNCRLEGLTRVSQMMGGGNGPTSDAWDFFLESMARTNQRHEDPAIATHRSRESVTHQDWLVQQGAIAKSSIAAIAQRLDVPTLLLSASAGAWPSGVEQGSRQLAALIPNSRLVLFDDAGAGIFAPEGGTPAAIPVIEAFLAEVVPLARPLGVGEGLSLRELEVLRLVAAGKSNQEIADELVISRNTVRRHVSHIFDKTGVANRAQAVAYARDHRIT